MEIRDLVDALKFFYKKLKKECVEPVPGDPLQKQNGTLLQNFEDQLAFKDFAALIEKLSAYQGMEVNIDIVNMLRDFIDKRENEMVQDTNVSPFVKINTPSNQLVAFIAVYLCTYLSDVVGKNVNPLSIIKSKVQSWDNPETGMEYSLDYIHQLMVTDDNRHVLHVGFLKEGFVTKKDNKVVVLDLASFKSAAIYLYYVAENVKRNLTGPENARAYGHSQTVKKYFDTLLAHLKNPKLVSTEHVENERKLMRAELNRKDFPAITMRYENEIRENASPILRGDDLLRNNLLKRKNDLFANRDQFIGYMAYEIMHPGNEWEAFASTMSHSALNKLIFGKWVEVKDKGRVFEFGKSTLTQAEIQYEVKNINTLLTGDNRHDRAVLYCAALAYKRWRESQGDKLSMWGRCDKSSKLRGLDKLLDAIATGMKSDKWDDLVRKFDKDTAEALNDGTVCYLVTYMKNVADKQAEDEKVLSVPKSAMKVA